LGVLGDWTYCLGTLTKQLHIATAGGPGVSGYFRPFPDFSDDPGTPLSNGRFWLLLETLKACGNAGKLSLSFSKGGKSVRVLWEFSWPLPVVKNALKTPEKA